MRKCTLEECRAEQCAPNNPYLCVRKTNGVIDGANSSCYTSLPQNLPSDCDFCDMSQCGINPLDNCSIKCQTNSGQFCPNGISCDTVPLSNCSTINGELHCCCDAAAPGPGPGPVNCNEKCSFTPAYCAGPPIYNCIQYTSEDACNEAGIFINPCYWMPETGEKCPQGYPCPGSGCCDPTYFCPKGWFPEDELPYSTKCKRCNGCDRKFNTPYCGPFALVATKEGASYNDEDGYIETPEGGLINMRINDLCGDGGVCRHDPLALAIFGEDRANYSGFEFNKEYILKQNGHEDLCRSKGQTLEYCQAKVKILVGKDTVCDN
jgi:hypothetical protein